jgi:hypothetical protein
MQTRLAYILNAVDSPHKKKDRLAAALLLVMAGRDETILPPSCYCGVVSSDDLS